MHRTRNTNVRRQAFLQRYGPNASARRIALGGREMNPSTMLKYPTAFLPVAMSLGALATVLTFVALHGTAPQADEGAAAHIWQLLMAAQAPIVLYFAIKWVPQSPRQAVSILGLQLVAALAAMAPVFLLHW